MSWMRGSWAGSTRRKRQRGAGVFVDAGGAVGAVALAEGDLAEQEVVFELGPFLAGCGAQLAERS